MSPAGIPEAIRRSMQILATHRALFGRPARGGKGARATSEADIVRVIKIFEDAGASWALVGAHAIGLLTEPRATADFNFVIEGVKLERVVCGLAGEFGARSRRADLDLSHDSTLLRVRSRAGG